MEATHNITGEKGVLQNFRRLSTPLPVNGLEKNSPALYATGIGYLPIVFRDGEVILAECLYSSDVAQTIISPTAITQQYKDVFVGWNLFANVREETGYLQLMNKDGINHPTLDMFCESNLWYHYLPTNI